MPERQSGRRGRFDHIGVQERDVGSDYTPEEIAYIRACEQYRKRRGRTFMSCRDHLIVALQLGYRLAGP
jgi:hypothetical protein